MLHGSDGGNYLALMLQFIIYCKIMSVGTRYLMYSSASFFVCLTKTRAISTTAVYGKQKTKKAEEAKKAEVIKAAELEEADDVAADVVVSNATAVRRLFH